MVLSCYSNLYNQGTPNFEAWTPIIIQVESRGPPKGTVRLKPCHGQRWNDVFLRGSCPGSASDMSRTGWSYSSTFFNYLTKHFLKYVTTHGNQHQTRILYDGHRSHISLTLTEWARQNKIILFVLPHTQAISRNI